MFRLINPTVICFLDSFGEKCLTLTECDTEDSTPCCYEGIPNLTCQKIERENRVGKFFPMREKSGFYRPRKIDPGKIK